MKTSTRNDPNDRESSPRAAQPAAVEGKTKSAVRCRLCRETIALETGFRPTAAVCPHCGLKFVFDPEREPLPVRGLRLRYSEVLAAQRGPGTVHHKRHEAHIQPVAQVCPPRKHYLAWASGLAISLAAAGVFFGGWFHHLLAR